VFRRKGTKTTGLKVALNGCRAAVAVEPGDK